MGRKMLLWLLAAAAVPALWTAPAGYSEERVKSVQTKPAATEAPAAISLPQYLEPGALTALELLAYEGPYVEDGTGDPVTDVAAMLVGNDSQRDVSAAMIAVQQGDRRLYFFLTWLPAGERVLVLEYNRAAYTEDAVTACECTAVRWESFQVPGIRVRAQEAGGLAVYNDRAAAVSGLRLRYKTYLAEAGCFLGGVTYCAYIGTLESGAYKRLEPEHYTPEHSRVVAILAE